MKQIEASLLAFSKNPLKFRKQIKEIKKANINNIHYDVMDNIFVPNKAFEGEKLKKLKKIGFTISVHLMVKNVNQYIDKFLKYNIDFLTFHCEPISIEQSLIFIEKIKSKKIKAGIAIKPNTLIKDYKELILKSDIVTIMGVEPGFGGQKFIESTIDKLIEIDKIKFKKTIIQLDGGVNLDVIKKTKKYVDFFVSGSFLMSSKDKESIINSIN